jgi:hypothetical protein
MACIVVKVIMDMFLSTEPHECLFLMLPTLRAALRQPDRTFRARVFDLIYNLALHAQMIEPSPSNATSQEGGTDGQTEAPEYTRFQPRIVRVEGEGRKRRAVAEVVDDEEVRVGLN